MRFVPRFALLCFAVPAFALPATADAAPSPAAPACLAGPVTVERAARTTASSDELLDAVKRRCAGVTTLEPGTLQPRAGELRAAAEGRLTYVQRDTSVTADSFGVVAVNKAGGVPLEVRYRTVEIAPTCTYGTAGGWNNSAANPVRVKGPRLLELRCADANGDGAKLDVVQQGKLGDVEVDGPEATYVPHDPLPTSPQVDVVKLRAGGGRTYTLHLQVGEGLNTPPVCTPVSIPQERLSDVEFPHLAFCEDADGDGITYEVKQGAGGHHGTVSIEQTGTGEGRLIYTKDPASNAAFDVVRLTATDGAGGSTDVLVGIGKDPGGACTISEPVFLDPGAAASARVTCTGPWGTPMYVRAAEDEQPRAGRAEVAPDGVVTYRAGRASGRFTVGVEWSADPSFASGVVRHRATFQVLPGATRALRTAPERPAKERVALPWTERGLAEAERLEAMLTETPEAPVRLATVVKKRALVGPTLTPDFDGTAAVAATLPNGREVGRGEAELAAGMSTVLGVDLDDAAIKPLRRTRRAQEVRLRITVRDETGAARTLRWRASLTP